MANGIDEIASGVAATLSVKYAVDEESIKETTEAVKEVETTLTKIKAEMRILESKDFEAYKALEREAQTRHYDDAERTLESYWRRRLEQVRGNAAEEVRIMEQHGTDLMRLQDMRNEAMLSLEREQESRAGGGSAELGGAGRPGGAGMAGFMGSIGWGSVMGMFSFAAMAGLVADSVKQLREARTEAREIGEIAGRDPEFAYGLAPTLQQLSRRYPGQISTQQAAGVAAQFAPIAGGGITGGMQIGQATEEAMLMGRGLGTDPQIIARLMRQFAILEGTSFPNLKNKIYDVALAAESAGMPMRDFANYLSTAVEEGRKYNISIDESSRLTTLFGRELQEGTITMNEIIQLQSAGAKAPMGVQVMLGEQFLGMGGPVGTYLRQVGATDALSAGVVMKAISEVSLTTGAGGIVGPSEQTKQQKDLLQNLRSEIDKARPEMIQKLAEQIQAPSAIAGTYFAQELFESQMGFSARTMATRQDQMDAALGIRVPTGGVLKPREGGLPPLEEIMTEAQKSFRDATSMVDKFKNALSEVTDVLVLEAELMAAVARGDMTEAGRIMTELGQYGGQKTAGAAFFKEMGGPTALLSMMPGGAPIAGAMAGANIGQFLRVNIFNKASDVVDANVSEGDPGERLIPQVPTNLS